MRQDARQPQDSDGLPVAPPTALRLLDSDSAAALTGLMATFEDLQSVLRCCERLVSELAVGDREPDGVVVEAIWTMALLSYARCFAAADGASTLTEDDLTAVQKHQDVLEWHKVLLQLRDHYANPSANPRERFSVGVAQDAKGAPSGIAVTSARQPLVDDVTVRQTGAIAYSLSALVNDRIGAQQEQVFAEVKDVTAADLQRFARLDVASPD